MKVDDITSRRSATSGRFLLPLGGGVIFAHQNSLSLLNLPIIRDIVVLNKNPSDADIPSASNIIDQFVLWLLLVVLEFAF